MKDVIKTGVLGFISVGVGALVKNNLSNNMPAGQKPLMKVAMGLGGLVIANMIVDKTSAYADAKIDDMVETTVDVVNAIVESEQALEQEVIETTIEVVAE